ncbi:MAG: sialidase family protein [Planctomycetota bacterium]
MHWLDLHGLGPTLLLASTLLAPAAAQKAPDVRIDTGSEPGAAAASQPRFAAAGGAIYAVWADERDGARDIYFNRSVDRGSSWLADATRLDTDTPPGSAAAVSPDIAVFGDAVFVTWSERRSGASDVYVNRSLDRGETWLPTPVRVDTEPAGASDSTAPRIAIGGTTVYIVWEDARRPPFRDIYINRSGDGGLSWQPTDTRLDFGTLPGVADSYAPQIAASGASVYVGWLDLRSGRPDVYFNRSTNQGGQWLPLDRRLDTNAPGASSSLTARLAATGNIVFAVWEERRDDLVRGDIYSNRSLDGGVTWQSADVRLDTGSPPGAAASLTPHLALLGTNAHVVWSDNRNGRFDIYFNRSVAAGLAWLPASERVDLGTPAGTADAVLPFVAANANGTFVAWTDMRSGDWDVYFNRADPGATSFQPGDLRLDTDASGSSAIAPQLAFAGESVVAGWLDDRSGDADLRANLAFGAQPYGIASAGTGGVRPSLDVAGPALFGATPTVQIRDARGGALAVLLLGIGPTTQVSIPIGGGVAGVLPTTSQGLGLGGAAGAAGEGTLDLPLPLPPSPALLGTNLNLQVGVRDSGSPDGFSLTNAVELWIG